MILASAVGEPHGTPPLAQPLFVSMFYSDARNATNATATPHFSGITLRDIVVENASGRVDSKLGGVAQGWAGAMVGLPEAPIVGLLLQNVTVNLSPGVPPSPGVAAWKCADIASGSAIDISPPFPHGCFKS
jgi:hypothetical protein